MEDPADNTTVVKVLNSFRSYLSCDDSRLHDPDTSTSSTAHSTMQSQYLSNLQVEEKANRSRYDFKLYHLESENQQLARSAKRTRIETELQLNTSTSNYEREVCKNQELALSLKHAQAREAELQGQLDAANVAAAAHRRCGLEIKRLSRDREQLLQTQEKLEAAESKVMELQRTLMTKELKMEIVTSERDDAQSLLVEQKRLNQELKEKVRELEAVQTQCMELEYKNKTLEQQLHALEDDKVIVQSMRSQMAGLMAAEKENKALKEENRFHRETQKKTMLLEEEVLSLQSKMERFQALQDQHAKLLVENEDLQKKLTTWESLDQVIGMNAKSPTDLSKKLRLLQHEMLLLTQNNSTVTCTMRDAVRSCHRLEEEKACLTAQLHEAMERKQQAHQDAQHLQRRCSMLIRERDGIKAILNSFDEVTTNTTGFTSQLSQRVREAEATTQRVNAHSVELEKQLAAAKEEAFNAKLKVQKLESDLALERNRLSVATRDFSRDEADQMCKKIEDLQQKLNTVTEENAKLEMRLEIRSLQGDYDPTRTKVLQFKLNPYAVAQQRRKDELLELQDECDRLRERVRQLEQGGAAAAPSEQPGDSAESVLPSRVIADLKKQVESEEMKNKRLREVFQKKVQEVRATCYELTGYQIDIPTEGQYKLTSMYAERQSDYLLFKKSGQMQLLETVFSQSLSDLISLHLHHQKSIPVFLSTVTLELFGRQTCPTMPLTQ